MAAAEVTPAAEDQEVEDTPAVADIPVVAVMVDADSGRNNGKEGLKQLFSLKTTA